MSVNSPDKNLIDRYLNGELSGIELENFRERMLQEEHFKNEVNFLALLRLGILFSKETELKNKILNKIKFRKPRIPFALKLIVTFLIVTVGGISLWFYVGNESSTRKGNLFFPFNAKENEKKPEKKLTETKNKAAENRSLSLSDAEEPVSNGNETQGHQSSSNALNGTKEQNQSGLKDSSGQLSEEDDIVIKKEKLLISANIPLIDKPVSDSKQADASQNSSLTHEAVEKLNPAAGVPDEEKVASNYMVEFWVSPINYRGYKMSRNKLIIYGIEEPDAVRLYRWNDAVFMKYGNEFYKLVNTHEYIPYQRLKESDVPLAIRQ